MNTIGGFICTDRIVPEKQGSHLYQSDFILCQNVTFDAAFTASSLLLYEKKNTTI